MFQWVPYLDIQVGCNYKSYCFKLKNVVLKTIYVLSNLELASSEQTDRIDAVAKIRMGKVKNLF